MAGKPSKGGIVRESWTGYNTLIERAFSKHRTHDGDPPSPSVPPVMGYDGVAGNSLDPLWEKVRDLKSRALETMPSKVKSLSAAQKEPFLKRSVRPMGLRQPSTDTVAQQAVPEDTSKGVSSQETRNEKESTPSRDELLERKFRYVLIAQEKS